MVCIKCGQKYSEGSGFCENCGTPIDAELPKTEAVNQPSNQLVSPGVTMGGE